MGSTFKALTLAMALDSGKVNAQLDVRRAHPLRYGKFTIHDFHAQNRVLTVPEIFTYSSNIGAARMALAMGVEDHKASCRNSASSTGCAPSCRKAPSRSCRSAGAS